MNRDQVPSLFLACGAGRPSSPFPAWADLQAAAALATSADGSGIGPSVITTLFPAMLQAPAGSANCGEP